MKNTYEGLTILYDRKPLREKSETKKLSRFSKEQNISEWIFPLMQGHISNILSQKKKEETSVTQKRCSASTTPSQKCFP